MHPRNIKSWLCVTALLGAAAGGPAFGHIAPVERPTLPASAPYRLAQNDWNNLSAQEKQQLREHRGQWNNYPPDYRSRLRQGAERYQGLSPEERERLQRSRERYETLDPKEREQLKHKYQQRQER